MAEQSFGAIEYGPFRWEICAALGADFWDELTAGLEPLVCYPQQWADEVRRCGGANKK